MSQAKEIQQKTIAHIKDENEVTLQVAGCRVIVAPCMNLSII